MDMSEYLLIGAAGLYFVWYYGQDKVKSIWSYFTGTQSKPTLLDSVNLWQQLVNNSKENPEAIKVLEQLWPLLNRETKND